MNWHGPAVRSPHEHGPGVRVHIGPGCMLHQRGQRAPGPAGCSSPTLAARLGSPLVGARAACVQVDSSIAAVEAESQAMLAKLDAQVDKISGEVLRRVLPEGVKV